jgi:4-hydroxy-3-polyprenylbenzoate decarboxylase
MPAEGVFHNLVVVSMKKRFPGHAQKIMYGLWGLGLMMLTKCFVIVDADVDVHDITAVTKALTENVDWRRDVTIVDGAVDQLDHSSLQDSYGGKIGVDATRKTRAPFPAAAALPGEAITQLVGSRWCETHGTLIVALDKQQHPPKDTMHKLWALCPDHNLVLVDDFVEVNNLSDVAWRALGNTDWRRDVLIHRGPIDPYDHSDAPRGHIGIDATTKNAEDGHPRGWPEEIFMSPEITDKVTRRWPEYGLT